jgi:hypothetical protein
MGNAAADGARGFLDHPPQGKARDDRELLAENTRLQRAAASLARERCSLDEQLRQGRAEREQLAAGQARLQSAVLAAEERAARFAEEYEAVERQNWDLVNLYAACHRLHASLDRAGVLGTIEDILTNLVGAEQAAVFERAEKSLRLVHSCRVDAARYGSVALDDGPIGRCGASGRTFLAGPRGLCERSAADPELTACVPLWLETRVTGVVAVFRLLPQKAALEEIDHELLQLISTQAGIALHCASLHAGSAAAGQSA